MGKERVLRTECWEASVIKECMKGKRKAYKLNVKMGIRVKRKQSSQKEGIEMSLKGRDDLLPNTFS